MYTPEERRLRNQLSQLDEIGTSKEQEDKSQNESLARRRSGYGGGGFSGGGGAVSSAGSVSEHHDLLGILDDDHTQYVHKGLVRTITANHAFTGQPTFSNIDINGGTINGITDLAVADGGTGVSTSDSWLNSRITTNANGTLNYDATSAVAPNHDSLAGFVANEHIDWTSTSENFSTSGTADMADLTVTTTNNVKLSLRETSTHKVDFTVGDTGQLTIHPSGNSIMLHNDSNMGSASFVSGFAGSGWQLSKDSANEYTAEFDNLTVRGTMSVYELLIQQIRASNGSVIIGSADKVVAVEQISGSSYKFTVESDEADGGSNGNDFIHFKEDDLIIAQKWSGTSGDPPYTPVKRVRATVTETSNSGGSSLDAKEFKATLYSTDSIASGDLPLDFVRIGNTSDADRQGGIYLTSEDSGAPFIDIFDDVDSWADWRLATKTKARLGRLDGINYDDGSNSGFDIPDTYGLFSKDVYLTGKITATSGFIGDNNAGWEIGSNYLKNVGNTSFIGIGSGGYNNSNQYVWLGAAASGNDTVGKFSLGDKLTWDGSNLYVKGQLILTNGDSVGAGITWKGTYNAGVAYVKNDAVVYQSASYIALQSTTGNTPSSGSSYWDLLADQGATGQQGNDGAPGSNGSPGADGHVYKQFYVYKNGSSAPSTPSGGSVNSSAVMTPPSGWSNTPSTPSSGQFTYASTSVWKQTNGSGSYAIDTAWASPSKFSGDTGAQGIQGETGED